MKTIISSLLFISLFVPSLSLHAQTAIVPDTKETVLARVVEVVSEEDKVIPGTETTGHFQTLNAEILEGPEKGKVVTLENDYLDLKKGDKFYLIHITDNLYNTEYYNVQEPYRLPWIIVLTALFIISVFLFGGMQGVRGLLSLIGSFLLILYVLLPGILEGFSPLLVATGVSALIIVLGSYITHGFSRMTTSAVIGMIFTIIITGGLAFFFVKIMKLTGFGSDEVVYLNMNAQGSIDVVGILLGGIMIGLLGVLYDIAIGQAVSVDELCRVAPHIGKKTIYERAIRIGKEHIGALVNTLAIAYVGASLPLLLLFSQSSTESVWVTINREIFATEIVRILIGSIGLVLAVPISTLVAVWLLVKKDSKGIDQKTLEEEKHALEHIEHAHHH